MNLIEQLQKTNHTIWGLRIENRMLSSVNGFLLRGSSDDFQTDQSDHEKELIDLCTKLEESLIEKMIAMSESQKQNEELTQMLRDAEKVITVLQEEKQDLTDRNQELERRLNRNSGNSHVPTSGQSMEQKTKNGKKAQPEEGSSDPKETSEDIEKSGRNHTRNSRTKSGMQQGAQPGHEGHGPSFLEPTQTEILQVPAHIAQSADWMPTGAIKRRQMVNMSLVARVTEYIATEYVNIHTGKKYTPPFPDGIVNNVNYGSDLKAICLYAKDCLNTSSRKVAEFVELMSDGVIKVSNGMIAGLSAEFANKSTEIIDKIRNGLKAAEHQHVDTTWAGINGVKHAVSVAVNDAFAYYAYSDHKGDEAMKALHLEGYEGILIKDCEAASFNYGLYHQLCLAHLLRDLQESIEREPFRKWNQEMKEFLQMLIHQAKEYLKTESDWFSMEEIQALETQYDKILAKGTFSYEKVPPRKKGYTKGRALHARFIKHKECILFFLYHRGIPWTNNPAEQAIRIFVRKRSQAVTFRSKKSVRDLCNFLSFLETTRKHGQNVLYAIENVFEGSTGWWTTVG